jgi:hypothetical protein
VDAGAITWSSSDTGVVSVNASGRLTVVGGGSATITAHADSLTATLELQVDMPVFSVPLVDTAALYQFSVVFGGDFHIAGKPLNPTWELQTRGYGMAVRAAAGGKVILITSQPSTGDYEVYLAPIGTPDGNETWAMSYDHVINLSVAAGDTVTAGDSIGGVQTFGTSDGIDIGRVEMSVWYNLANGNADMMCPSRLGTASFNGVFDRLQKSLRPELSSDCLSQDLIAVASSQARRSASGTPLKRRQ